MSAIDSRADGPGPRADETFALSQTRGSVGITSSVLGVFFLGCGALFALLMAGGIAGGKAAAGAVILAGSGVPEQL
jgi:hypothetical protein